MANCLNYQSNATALGACVGVLAVARRPLVRSCRLCERERERTHVRKPCHDAHEETALLMAEQGGRGRTIGFRKEILSPRFIDEIPVSSPTKPTTKGRCKRTRPSTLSPGKAETTRTRCQRQLRNPEAREGRISFSMSSSGARLEWRDRRTLWSVLNASNLLLHFPAKCQR
jgi:hypothetical protein